MKGGVESATTEVLAAHEVVVTVTYGLLNAQGKETPYLLWNPSVRADDRWHAP